MQRAPLQFTFVLLLAICFTASTTLVGQEDTPPNQSDKILGDMELIDRVDVLRQQLESPSIAQRDKAQQELIALGTRVLDHLDPADPAEATDLIQRISKVRTGTRKNSCCHRYEVFPSHTRWKNDRRRSTRGIEETNWQ